MARGKKKSIGDKFSLLLKQLDELFNEMSNKVDEIGEIFKNSECNCKSVKSKSRGKKSEIKKSSGKKRGRKPGTKLKKVVENDIPSVKVIEDVDILKNEVPSVDVNDTVVKRRRGRPCKNSV